MKKKEIYILISIILIAVLGIVGLNITKNKKSTPTPTSEPTADTTPTPSTDSSTLSIPSEQPVGIWVVVCEN